MNVLIVSMLSCNEEVSRIACIRCSEQKAAACMCCRFSLVGPSVKSGKPERNSLQCQTRRARLLNVSKWNFI